MAHFSLFAAFFRALPASMWGHCLQVLVFTSIWETPQNAKSTPFYPCTWGFPGIYRIVCRKLTCFHASFFPFCPLCWSPLFLPFLSTFLPCFSSLESALFCRANCTAQSLEGGRFRMDLSTKFGKEIPSRNLREKGSVKGPFESDIGTR